MTRYAPPPPDFTCVICGTHYEHSRWPGWAAEFPIPPLCRNCHRDWGKSIGGPGDRNRDRRIMRQISALANVLHFEAYRKSKGEGSLYART